MSEMRNEDGGIEIVDKKTLFKLCVDDARKAITAKGSDLDPEAQVKNVFAYSATSPDFKIVINSPVSSPAAIELRAQIRYICELGLDTAKGRKLVYVKTRNTNLGTKQAPQWHVFPDIQESYHALIYLLIKEGALSNIVVLHTYQAYPVEYSGSVSDVPIVKNWEVSPADRGDYTGCFVVLTYPDGIVQTTYHHAADIRATHQQFTKSANTWKNHEQAMIAKSAIMDATRYIPVFNDVIAKVVEHYDQSMDYEREGGSNLLGERITPEQAEAIVNTVESKGYSLPKFIEGVGKKGWPISNMDELPVDGLEIITDWAERLPPKDDKK